MTERKVFTLGGKTFTRSDVLARKVKDVLFGHNLEAKLKPDEEKLILDVLRQGHPRADEKIGCGLKVIKVGAHPQYPESRCFHIVRTDDSTADFSYRKCIDSMWGIEKSKKKKREDDESSSYEKGLVLSIKVEYSPEKRKREEGAAKEEEEEADTVTDLNDEDEDRASKKQKTEGKKGKKLVLSPAIKIKRCLGKFGVVAYVEYDEANPEAGVIARYREADAVPKAQEAIQKKLEVEDLPELKLVAATVLTGAEEEAYYQRMASDRLASRERRFSAKESGRTGGRRGRGGRKAGHHFRKNRQGN